MTDLDDRAQNIQDTATGGAGEGEPALSVAEIRAALADQFGALAELTTVESLPPDTSIRANGYFDDPEALEDYLVQGGLLAYDVDGNPVKLGLAYVVEAYDPVDDTYYYQVYIADHSPEAE